MGKKGAAKPRATKQDDMSSDGDDDHEREIFAKNWGKAADDFYGGEDPDLESGDEEDAAYQEKEVLF